MEYKWPYNRPTLVLLQPLPTLELRVHDLRAILTASHVAKLQSVYHSFGQGLDLHH